MRYSPDTWKVKNILNAEEIELLGYSYILEGTVYLVYMRENWKIVLFESSKEKLTFLKDKIMEKEAVNFDKLEKQKLQQSE